MSDVVASARAARERLAQGLGALQGQGVPEQLMNAAEPIARAMNALHRVEITNGQAVTEAGPLALDSVRTALGILQSHNVNDPSVEAALEAVAGSLGLIHRLVKLTSAPPPANPAQATPFGATALAAPGAPGPMPHPGAHAPQAQPQQQYAPPAQQQYVPPAQQQYAPPAQQQPLYAPMPRQAPQAEYAAQPHPPAQAPAVAAAGMAPDNSFAPSSTLQSQGAERTAPTPVPGQLRLEAALGAHSATNFYKGLSGNDVVDAGGIFIATYQIPRIGTPLLLKISLPGGYEFDAQAVVRWTREPSSGSDGASPGFGAQFTQISSEGRQLVYRYVRNREPLFHDDL